MDFKFEELPDFKKYYKIARHDTLPKLIKNLENILYNRGFKVNTRSIVYKYRVIYTYFGGMELTYSIDGISVSVYEMPDWEYGFKANPIEFIEMFKDILNKHICDEYFIPKCEREDEAN